MYITLIFICCAISDPSPLRPGATGFGRRVSPETVAPSLFEKEICRGRFISILLSAGYKRGPLSSSNSPAAKFFTANYY